MAYSVQSENFTNLSTCHTGLAYEPRLDVLSHKNFTWFKLCLEVPQET